MSYLRSFGPKNTLNDDEKFSVFYHSLFDYPLTFSEIVKWQPKNYGKIKEIEVVYKNGYYFIKGKEGLFYKRKSRERIFKSKIEIARKAARIISIIPSIKMIGLTGSLAMGNSQESGDIDFMIVTKKGKLWSTRLLTYLILKIVNIKVRKAGQGIQKDRLCLNIWLDESDLLWRSGERNIYTAHEILQVIPLIDKDNTFKKIIDANKWVFEFWSNRSKRSNSKNGIKDTKLKKLSFVEFIFYKIQYSYMKDKITKEKIFPTRAIFHPRNLSKEILDKIHP